MSIPSLSKIVSQTDIAALLPHAGSMLLIDSVHAWDAEQIHCVADNHRAADHPLRVGDRLPTIAAIEYAAQAMALHGRLNSASGASPGTPAVAAVNGFVAAVDRLDTLAGRLDVVARLSNAMRDSALFGFTLHQNGEPVAEGNLLVVWVTA